MSNKAKLIKALTIAAGAGAGAAGGIGAATVAHNIYKAHQQALEEAKKEIDPVETTLDGLEKYVLDPVGELTPGQAAAGLAALTATGIGGKYLYDKYKGSNT